jgi:hypothetical protein
MIVVTQLIQKEQMNRRGETAACKPMQPFFFLFFLIANILPWLYQNEHQGCNKINVFTPHLF